MNILILVQDYPNLEGGVSLAYVRTRNVFYKRQGAQIDVINFNTDKDYQMDGINVHPVKWFKKENAKKYDLLISHAPNLRSHFRFIMKYGYLFLKKVFFFHGHEVLKINMVYSEPYPFVKKSIIRRKFQDLYDDIKLKVWNLYFTHNVNHCYLVYVSNWMRDEFYKWTRINSELYQGHEYITYNSVGEVFEKESFLSDGNKLYDFITIRSTLDGSKYSIDIVNNLAWNNPKYKFLLIGKGDFFKHNKKASNLTWINRRLNHVEMIEMSNKAFCALMPTRTDAQGVMMCEMAAFGMPVITSDIPVCHEVFGDLSSIRYLNNELCGNQSIEEDYNLIKGHGIKHTRYFYSKICTEEYTILTRIFNNSTSR